MDVVPINRPLVGLDGGWASHNSIPVIKTCMASTNLNAEEKQLNIPEDKQVNNQIPEDKQVNNQRSAQSEIPRDGQNRQSGKAAAFFLIGAAGTFS